MRDLIKFHVNFCYIFLHNIESLLLPIIKFLFINNWTWIRSAENVMMEISNSIIQQFGWVCEVFSAHNFFCFLTYDFLIFASSSSSSITFTISLSSSTSSISITKNSLTCETQFFFPFDVSHFTLSSPRSHSSVVDGWVVNWDGARNFLGKEFDWRWGRRGKVGVKAMKWGILSIMKKLQFHKKFFIKLLKNTFSGGLIVFSAVWKSFRKFSTSFLLPPMSTCCFHSYDPSIVSSIDAQCCHVSTHHPIVRAITDSFIMLVQEFGK